MNKPISVGITGGIGTGKTLVTKLFSLLNTPIYDADSRAKDLMNTKLVNPIIALLGSESYLEGVMNRAHIAKIVFGDKKRLAELNSIVHPAVVKDYKTWMNQQKNTPYVLKEAALLIESGSYKQLDKLIVITSPQKLRLSRIKKRDPFRTEQEINSIIANQMLDKEKVNLADFVIQNDEQSLLIPQVLLIDKKLRNH